MTKVTFAPDSEHIALLKSSIREVEDFPRKGIWTQDVTPLLQRHDLFAVLIDELVALLKDVDFDIACGIDSRGFMFGPPLADSLGKQFYPIFKSKGRDDTVKTSYEYEYGKDMLEIPKEALKRGTKVLIVDDQIVTGGTVLAAARLIEKIGAEVVGCVFILTQTTYDGLEKVKYPVYALFEKNPTH